jgi:putative peptide zinc metalloprotease protein
VSSPALHDRRYRALGASSVIAAAMVVVFGFVPIPSYTLNEGVLWQPDEVRLRAQHDGFIAVLEVDNNQLVTTGMLLLTLHDPFLQNEARIARARVRELKSRYRASRASSHVEAGIVGEELRVARSELHFILDKTRSMSVIAFKNGKILLPEADDLPGRFIRKGDLLGYILDGETPTVRMAVSQDHIGQLRQNVVDIRVRFASNPATDFSAEILRQSPEATNQLPSAALATTGGGKFIAATDNEDGLVIQQKVFLVDLKLDFQQQQIPLGTRAYVRVNHGSETLASQWYRRVRQVFLRQFNV